MDAERRRWCLRCSKVADTTIPLKVDDRTYLIDVCDSDADRFSHDMGAWTMNAREIGDELPTLAERAKDVAERIRPLKAVAPEKPAPRSSAVKDADTVLVEKMRGLWQWTLHADDRLKERHIDGFNVRDVYLTLGTIQPEDVGLGVGIYVGERVTVVANFDQMKIMTVYRTEAKSRSQTA
jgi:hypothetical protein